MASASPLPETSALEQRRLAIVRALRTVDAVVEDSSAVVMRQQLAVQDRQLQEMRKTIDRLVVRLDRLADEVEVLARQQERTDLAVAAVPDQDTESDPLPRRSSVPAYEPARAGDDAYDALLGPTPRRSACA